MSSVRGVRPRWHYNRRRNQWYLAMSGPQRSRSGVDIGSVLMAACVLMFVVAAVLFVWTWS